VLALAYALQTAVAAYLIFGEAPYGKYSYEKLVQDHTSDPGARSRFYRLILVLEWGLSLLVLLALRMAHIPLGEAGLRNLTGGSLFGLTTGESVSGMIIGGLIGLAGGLGALHLMLRLKPDVRQNYARRLGSVSPMLPANGRERLQFAAVSITAGVCEEFLFRGFLMLYLTGLVPGLPAWGAMVISSVIFGLAHWYQGRSGVAGTGVLGLFLGLVYLLTGSLYPSMVLHAIIDLNTMLAAWSAGVSDKTAA
jgi:membrane protease YdiL (CAAX protease family)